MDNGMEYYSDQPSYYDQTLYNDQPVFAEDQSANEVAALDLPPEPEDSPYDDPVVRHILSIKDDDYRRRMLSYLNENVQQKAVLHPAVVWLAILLCFPLGLCLMYFGTRWGVFAKVVITVFTLGIALAVYEILVYGGIIPTPSLIETVSYIFSQLTA